MCLSQKTAPIIWDIQYSTPPTVLRYCKKCGKKSEFICSGEFRVNAQQKTLDIWLIYKCVQCNTTWNSTIYSRISPQRLGVTLLERFHSNDEILALQYAMDISLLQKNGAEIKIPTYQVVGEDVSLAEEVNIKIQSQYILPLKISSILRTKLGISQREFDLLLSNNQIQSNKEKDLRKGKLTSEIIISIFQPQNQSKNGGNYV